MMRPISIRMSFDPANLQSRLFCSQQDCSFSLFYFQKSSLKIHYLKTGIHKLIRSIYQFISFRIRHLVQECQNKMTTRKGDDFHQNLLHIWYLISLPELYINIINSRGRSLLSSPAPLLHATVRAFIINTNVITTLLLRIKCPWFLGIPTQRQDR